MAIPVQDKGGEFEVCPAGNFAGHVSSVIYLGTVKEEYQGVVSEKPQIRLAFELNKKTKEGRPFTLSTFSMTASMNKKAGFRKLAQGIVTLTPETEKNFDAENLIGKPTMVNVIHKPGKDGAVFANIAGCSPIPEGMPVTEPTIEPFVFNIITSPLADIGKLSDKLQEVVRTTPEYASRIKAGETDPSKF